MKKLIVETNRAPIEKIFHILRVLEELAKLVEDKTSVAKGCDLEWRIYMVKYEQSPDWVGLASVCMGFDCHPHESPGGRTEPSFFAPITLVDEIVIRVNDNGVCWHNKSASESVTAVAERISGALGLGQLEGRRYEANSFPRLNR